jgi:TPR repeat protein
VERHPPQARAFYLEAARSGWPEAQFRLGRLYALGSDVEKSDERAKMWLVRAAMQGNEEARSLFLDRYRPAPNTTGPATEQLSEAPSAPQSSPAQSDAVQVTRPGTL